MEGKYKTCKTYQADGCYIAGANDGVRAGPEEEVARDPTNQNNGLKAER